MANWKEYTTKTTPEDADEIMIADSKANASKRTPFSGLWNWIAGKLATAVISQLETQNKSIIPALNELNSKAAALISTAKQKDITEIPINGALKFALVFCGNNMYFANTNSSGTQAFVRAVSAPEKTVTCTTIQNKLIIRNDDENAKAYMCKIF